MVDEEYSKNRLLPLIKGKTNAATLSLNSDEDLLELVFTSPDEEEDDRPSALPSIVYTGGKLSTRSPPPRAPATMAVLGT